MTQKKPRRQVLLVEDDDDIAEDMEDILTSPKNGGYDMVVAKNVKSGIQRARELIGDLYAAILDHHLPDGCGTEVYMELKELSPDFAERRVAVWSSYPPDAEDDYRRLKLTNSPPILWKSSEELLGWLRSLEDVTCDEGERGEELSAAIKWLEDVPESDLEELDE